MSTALSIFKNQLNELMKHTEMVLMKKGIKNDLIKFRTKKTLLEQSLKVNPRDISLLFMNKFSKYYQEIFNQEEKFFLECDFKKENEKEDKDKSKEDDKSKDDATNILRIKELWKNNLTDMEKKKYWLLFQGLLKSGSLINSDKYYYIIEYFNSNFQ